MLATPADVLSPRMVRIIRDLAEDWRRLDERIDHLSNECRSGPAGHRMRAADERPGPRKQCFLPDQEPSGRLTSAFDFDQATRFQLELFFQLATDCF